MQLTFTSLVLVCLFSITNAFSQGNISLDENTTKARLDKNHILITLAFKDSSPSSLYISGDINLEILDINDNVLVKSFTQHKTLNAIKSLEIPININDTFFNEEELIWYRLQYEIVVTNNPQNRIKGIISFSQMLSDIFKLHAFGSKSVTENNIYKVRVLALNPANKKAVENVEIKGEIDIEDSEKVITSKATTDKEGFALLKFSVSKLTSYDDIEIEISGKKNGVTRKIEEELTSLVLKNANLQTDKMIYQPGQKAKFRVYFTDLENRPLKNQDLILKVENENDEETVLKKSLTTSEFGIASTDWEIPDSAKLGDYKIVVTNSEEEFQNVQKVKITSYELPNFYTYVQPDKAFYLPKQTKAKVKITGEYLFGKPVQKGNVRIAFAKENSEYEIPEIKGSLNKDGTFSGEIDFNLKNHLLRGWSCTKG